ncbi:hypothetical protein C6I20_09005 [Aeromicrobium sp. A1-2]|uniref:hypothetical protein n=1 Tax=Aeromicrobium sp. A1-2 TaxID=2107713 RepID=UPI000E4E9D35|nr:hypothetical protein [Aeromicrobium sp. A1-2]AXT85309.1 hypothetical protein C6I20_09005 [Aeromicrobium sp. A1-2]
MKKTAVVLISTIVGATTLAGCGGSNPYCDVVKKDQDTLNTFGQKRTDADYAKYAATFKAVAKDAPSSIKKDWMTLSTVTQGIITAQKDAGLKLEDMTDAAKVKKIDSGQLTKLNTAYKKFNATTAQRNAVVKNVLQECDIKLK